MASFFFGNLAKFGFSLGAGLGAAGGSFYCLGMFIEDYLDHRRVMKIRRNSTRRPPSVSGNTEPLPRIPVEDGDDLELG